MMTSQEYEAEINRLDQEIDRLLGTELPERDLQAEEDWEHYWKGTESGLDGKGK